jgi:acyl dehydratase
VSAPSSTAGLFFEDFRVGQTFISGLRSVTQEDLDDFIRLSGDGGAIHQDADYARSMGFEGPVVHGPFGVAIVFGLLFEQRLVEPTAIAMLDLQWRFVGAVVVGDRLRSTMTITRRRRSTSRQAGVLGRHFILAKEDGTVVQEGSSALLVQARDAAPSVDTAICTDFCTVPWARALEPLLLADARFTAATSSYDGTIGLSCGRETVQLRIYRGRILEVGRSTPSGPSFTLHGSELAWTELARADRNDFIARTSKGAFSMSGSAYEYLRMNKALVVLWDAVRALAAQEPVI